MVEAPNSSKGGLSRLPGFTIFVMVLCLFLVLDRITKSLALAHMVAGLRYQFIPGLLDFTLVFNKGAAFGILADGGVIFLVIASVVSLAILLYVLIAPRHGIVELVSLGLICAGAWGNVIDRLVNDGQVTDFIHTTFMEFPVFNVADCAITIGVMLMIVLLIINYIRDVRRGDA